MTGRHRDRAIDRVAQLAVGPDDLAAAQHGRERATAIELGAWVRARLAAA